MWACVPDSKHVSVTPLNSGRNAGLILRKGKTTVISR